MIRILPSQKFGLSVHLCNSCKYLKRIPTTNFVADDNGKIVGIIMAGHDGRRGYIHHTAVLPDYRNQGIGRKLVESAMSALEEESINKVALVAFKLIHSKLINESI